MLYILYRPVFSSILPLISPSLTPWAVDTVEALEEALPEIKIDREV